MGSPKALLKIQEKTFLQHIIGILSNQYVKDIHVVLGAHAQEIKPSVTGLPVSVIINEQWQNGQLSSLITGLDAIDENNVDGVLVWPVDHPLVSGVLVEQLINTFMNDSGKLIIPKFEGKRGHPVIFPKSLFNELRAAPLDKGARSVVYRYEETVYELETSEIEILINIDTPEAYEKFITNGIFRCSNL